MTSSSASRCRIVITSSDSAAYNMAVDEAIFNACRRGKAPPTLRLYTWRPPAVSLGYGQNIDIELDPRRCRAYGIDIVRRPSGGRAVLHDEEMTYALVIPEGYAAVGRSAYEEYRWTSDVIIRALRQMEVPAELSVNAEQEELPGEAEEEIEEYSLSHDEREGACFAHTARYEIEVYGRKLVGSAQRRAAGYVLQHGSLLLGPGHKRLPLLLPHTQYARRERMTQELDRHTTCLSELVGRPVPFEEIARRIAREFAATLDISNRFGDLTVAEKTEATRLVEDKYGYSDWTHRRAVAYVP